MRRAHGLRLEQVLLAASMPAMLHAAMVEGRTDYGIMATGQVAGGSNVMCFTTGRGSAFGCKPTPSIKLATNTDVYTRMIDDMDINCGDVLDGVTIEKKGEEIFRKVLAVASGEHTKSEDLGYGDLEFVPWQVGATM